MQNNPVSDRKWKISNRITILQQKLRKKTIRKTKLLAKRQTFQLKSVKFGVKMTERRSMQQASNSNDESKSNLLTYDQNSESSP